MSHMITINIQDAKCFLKLNLFDKPQVNTYMDYDTGMLRVRGFADKIPYIFLFNCRIF